MLRTTSLALAAALFLSAAPLAQDPHAPAASTSPAPAADPAAVLTRLKAGNERFAARASQPLPIDEHKRKAAVGGQSPMAVVLSCADSRVPPEVIFNTGLGDLFVVRVAGGVTDQAVLASIEYAVDHLGPALVVVMGHESCGAVKAAIETPPGADGESPHVAYLLQQIRPSFERLREDASVAALRDAVLVNVEQVVNDLMNKSATVRARQADGRLGVVGAYYELASGRVHFSAPVPRPTSVATTAGRE
ncbi:MAG: carbonic anhydrase [Acidobacteriota bacterium]